MKLWSLVEPDLLARAWMSDDALERVFQSQPAVGFPFVIDPHIAAISFDCRFVSGLKGCLPRQPETVAAVQIAQILDALGPKFLDYARIERFENLAVVRERSFAAFARLHDTAEVETRRKLMRVRILAVHGELVLSRVFRRGINAGRDLRAWSIVVEAIEQTGCD